MPAICKPASAIAAAAVMASASTSYAQETKRRGTNWRNLVSNWEDRSIEFSDGPDHCVAVHKAGPPWQGGHVYMLHTSICRTGTAPARSEDVGYALGSVQIRQYDPVGNLRKAGE
jgi:hypothetical protein